MYYYNLMGPPSYMQSVFDRNVVMRRFTVHKNARLDSRQRFWECSTCGILSPCLEKITNMWPITYYVRLDT